VATPLRLDSDLTYPCLMGVLNVTPDSFSDGGRFFDGAVAVERARQMVRDGAAIVDVGGESTRPGSDPVSLEEELRRVVPVVEALAATGAPLSVDTTKAEVARRALQAGAAIVNDVTALRGDPGMAEVIAAAGCPVCLMHMLGEPKTMQEAPRYRDVVGEVLAFLEERLAYAVDRGVDESQVMLDPGIGFGKTLQHNLLLLKHLDRLVALGRPVVVGTSRKRFLGAIVDAGPDDRVLATAVTTVLGVQAGAAVIRVHDVRPNREALQVAMAVREVDEDVDPGVDLRTDASAAKEAEE
jgi:dihydropteroate synthase